jgi:hypothetical protein
MLGLWVAPMAWAEDLLVIANKTRARTLDVKTVQELFSGKRRTAGADWRVILIDQDSGKDVYGLFYKRLLDKEPSAVRAQWAELVFSGKARAPEAVPDDDAVIGRVLSNRDAMGYVRATADISKVSVILRLK